MYNLGCESKSDASSPLDYRRRRRTQHKRVVRPNGQRQLIAQVFKWEQVIDPPSDLGGGAMTVPITCPAPHTRPTHHTTTLGLALIAAQFARVAPRSRPPKKTSPAASYSPTAEPISHLPHPQPRRATSRTNTVAMPTRFSKTRKQYVAIPDRTTISLLRRY